jgi:hypothetical protein
MRVYTLSAPQVPVRPVVTSIKTAAMVHTLSRYGTNKTRHDDPGRAFSLF